MLAIFLILRRIKHRISFAAIAATLAGSSFANAADTYTIDPAHTRVGFSARHLGISHVKGSFKEFTGKLVMDGDKLKEATATIQVQSIDTGIAQRDNHLRTADFFAATNYPTITFKTKRVEENGGEVVMIADFTMRGVTKELRLPVTLSKPIKDPWGNTRIGLEAKTKLNRKDYGMKYNDLLETGIPAVGDEIEIDINGEAIKDAPGEKPSTKSL
jgi:polyisoprenoid-binding protein YceI